MLRILIVSLAHLCLIKNSWGFVQCSGCMTEANEGKSPKQDGIRLLSGGQCWNEVHSILLLVCHSYLFYFKLCRLFFCSLSTLLPSVCKTVVQADIVFLVDESWSIGHSGFSRVKDFISAIISSFKDSMVGPEGVRFGVTVFGDVPRSGLSH